MRSLHEFSMPISLISLKNEQNAKHFVCRTPKSTPSQTT